MRKVILILLVFISAKVNAQVYQEMPQYGYRANRMAFDSSLQIPTVCGIPTLKSIVKANKNGAIAYDSCNARFYAYNPKTLTWTAITSGSTDTTSLNNRINLKIDSLKRSNDSVYAYKNGTRFFQFKDSIGGGTTPTLQQVTTSGSTTTNSISVSTVNIGSTGNQLNLNKDNDGSFVVVNPQNSFEVLRVNNGVDAYLKIGGGDYPYLKIKTTDGNVELQAPSLSGTIALKSDTTNKFVNRLERTLGKDSIVYFVGANRFAIKDSVGNTSGFVPYTGATSNVDLGTKNITANAYFNGFTSMFAKNDTIILTKDSTPVHLVKGTGGQAFKLPVATTLANGTIFSFNNNQSSGAINVLSNSIANTLIKSVPSGAYLTLELTDNTTATGIWDAHFQTPSDVSWSTNTLDYNGSITSAQWNGTTVAYNRGGTGQSSTFTQGGIIYGSTTTAMASTSAGTSGQILKSNGTSAPSWVNQIDTLSLSNRINLKLNIADTAGMLAPYTRQRDTIPMFVFGAGSATAGDTAAFSTSAIYGSFYNDFSDTIVLTSFRIGLQGTSPSINTTIYFNDSLGITAGATKIVNAGTTATNIYTGTSVTSLDNTKIPPGNWVWVQTGTVTTKPTFFILTLFGYKSRR